MAGDWIKMRSELQTHPKVVRILSAMRPHDVQTKTDKFRVIGGLHAVWSVFDTHSSDGVLVGYTPDLLDHVIGWEGFSAALIDVDWLSFDGSQTLMLPEFDEHNGQSAKRRAEDQKRKRDARKSPQSVRNLSAPTADKKRTREREDKREDIKEERVGGSHRLEARASRLPDDWEPNDEQIDFCREQRPDLNPAAVANRFHDYWIAEPGAKGRKVDWTATWRNWVRNEKAQPACSSPEQRDKSPPLHTLTNEALEAEARRVGANTMGCNREAVIDRIRAKMRATEEGRA